MTRAVIAILLAFALGPRVSFVARHSSTPAQDSPFSCHTPTSTRVRSAPRMEQTCGVAGAAVMPDIPDVIDPPGTMGSQEPTAIVRSVHNGALRLTRPSPEAGRVAAPRFDIQRK